MAAPIEVFDKDMLTRFFFGAGPGNSGPEGTAPCDPRYRENTWLLLRGVEGKWFHAWSQWNSAVRPLLAR